MGLNPGSAALERDGALVRSLESSGAVMRAERVAEVV